MKRTDNLRRQHDKLLAYAADIDKLVGSPMTPEAASKIRVTFSGLMGVLALHLAEEDKSLYPTLISGINPEARAIAKKFKDEMGGIGKVVGDFNTKWTPSYIATNAAFPREWKSLLSALGTRIQKENSDLYPLADKL